MSELIQQNTSKRNVQRQLLATASALVLSAYFASGTSADAADTDRPTVWVELGGQVEQVQGISSSFSAPFMTAISPMPDVYSGDIFARTQRAAKFAFGAEGQLSFAPAGSDWVFTAGLRFGRSQNNRNLHQQGDYVHGVTRSGSPSISDRYRPFADSKSSSNESHTILDFTVGKDVGLGRFGNNGTSIISAGVRFAQFSSELNTRARGRPSIQFFNTHHPNGRPVPTFYNYTMFASATRNFHGVGPSLSWNGSAALIGNSDGGELTFDWGVNGALLFGRQKVKGSHNTQAYHLPLTTDANYVGYYYARTYLHPHPIDRFRSAAIPNLGGIAGISVKYPNAKVSFGYRADFFFGAMDTGIDTRHSQTVGFHGPFATISIGLGG